MPRASLSGDHSIKRPRKDTDLAHDETISSYPLKEIENNEKDDHFAFVARKKDQASKTPVVFKSNDTRIIILTH